MIDTLETKEQIITLYYIEVGDSLKVMAEGRDNCPIRYERQSPQFIL